MMFRLRDVSRTHGIAFLMAHLPLNRLYRPQSGLNQRTTRHRPENMPTHVCFSVIAHDSQSLIHRILTHRLTWIVIARENQLSVSIHAFDFSKIARACRDKGTR